MVPLSGPRAPPTAAAALLTVPVSGLTTLLATLLAGPNGEVSTVVGIGLVDGDEVSVGVGLPVGTGAPPPEVLSPAPEEPARSGLAALPVS